MVIVLIDVVFPQGYEMAATQEIMGLVLLIVRLVTFDIAQLCDDSRRLDSCWQWSLLFCHRRCVHVR